MKISLHRDSVTEIYEGLDKSAYPESAGLLEDILDGSIDLLEDPGNVADELMYRCDMPGPLPAELLELAVVMYEEAMDEDLYGWDDGAAANNLGAHYYNGARGLPQDFARAVELYKKAAAQGSSTARENLGYCYYYGRHVAKDYEEAFRWFSMGAFLGESGSLYKIGDMYRNGLYVEQSDRMAYLIYLRCINDMPDDDRSFAAGPVYLRLGDMHLKGLGTAVDPAKALDCYQKAEYYLTVMVNKGEYMYRKSLESAIAGQDKARQAMKATTAPERGLD
ncbi:MAG: sel1 repeat family protein [Abditibacteriota bacterium]|nr:sel1 repeat family protein [Abditibacteriota bacterium]MBR4748512.1 sel1 repeat family protein [Abditibacteriota bacterium]